MATLNSIYHTARCGSTLLVALLSAAAPAYAEPPWAVPLWLDGADLPSARQGAIVKVPSLAIFHRTLLGPKVFLYRPLAQHIAKYKTLPASWLAQRRSMIEEYIGDVDFNGNTQAFASLWARQLELALSADCLMIASNRLFQAPAETAVNVLDHFGIDGKPDLRFIDVNVKALELIGQTDPIAFPLRRSVARVDADHGLFRTDEAMQDPSIKAAVEWVEDRFPALTAFTR